MSLPWLMPSITASMLTAIDGDATLPDHDGLVRTLTETDGVFGMPADQVADMLVTGGPAEIATHLKEYAVAGAERVVMSIAAGDWRRQVELLAEARDLLDD